VSQAIGAQELKSKHVIYYIRTMLCVASGNVLSYDF
jgi:hypothetical protein